MKKTEFVNKILETKSFKIKEQGVGQAPSNIALSKYWGKRNKELNLPLNGSISISLSSKFGTKTIISISNKDELFLNDKLIEKIDPIYQRLFEFLNLFKVNEVKGFKVITTNTIPTASGLASSASGFASVVLAINDLFSYNLNLKELSLLARLGSGSACRSLFENFSYWEAGSDPDGFDSYAKDLDIKWDEFKIAYLKVNSNRKEISSRDAMNLTMGNSDIKKLWVDKCNLDLKTIQNALSNKDFKVLGETAENNSLFMHSLMLSSKPSIIYLEPKSIEYIKKIQKLRKDKVADIYLTIDAGPNIKVLFLQKDEELIKKHLNLIVLN